MSNLSQFPRGIRLFSNPVLDLLSRMHPLLLCVIWLPIAAFMIAVGKRGGVPSREILLLVPSGLLVWFVSEYVVHRWLFHFHPRAVWLKRMFYMLHEHHHRYQERDRLVAPPLMSGLLFCFFLTFLTLCVGLPFGFARMWTVFGGVVIGYLIYDYVHLYVHIAQPSTRIGKFLCRCHDEHHKARPDCWFSVSCPWLDYVFRTHARQLSSPAAGGERPHAFQLEELPRLVREHEISLKEFAERRQAL